MLETGKDTKLTIILEDGIVIEEDATNLLDKWQRSIANIKLFFVVEKTDIKLCKVEKSTKNKVAPVRRQRQIFSVCSCLTRVNQGIYRCFYRGI